MAESNEMFPLNVEQAVGDSFVDRQISGGMESPNNKLIEFLVSDRSIPKHLRKQYFWGFSDKEMAISNLDEKQIRSVMLGSSIANKFYLMSKPDYKHTWEDEINYSNLRAKLFVKLNRSKMGFEREMQVKQIRENYVEGPQRRGGGGIVGSVKDGFSRLFGGR